MGPVGPCQFPPAEILSEACGSGFGVSAHWSWESCGRVAHQFADTTWALRTPGLCRGKHTQAPVRSKSDLKGPVCDRFATFWNRPVAVLQLARYWHMTTGCLVILDLCTCPSKHSNFNSSLSFLILDSLEPETQSETRRLGNNLTQQCEKLMSE